MRHTRALLVAVTALAWQCGAAQPGDWGACPRDALRGLLEASAEHREVSDLAAVERDVLRLCNARQTLVNKIVEGEARLAELRGEERVASTGSNGPVMVAAVEAAPVKSDERAEADVVVEAQDPVEERSMVFVDPLVVEAEATADPALSWTTVYGSAGDWIAGVSDGERVWFVREGDALPSGEKVVAVRVRPPAVTISRDGSRWQLPGPGG